VLSNFGVCTYLQSKQDIAKHGKYGTPGYRAPEVKYNKPYGFVSDFWGFGVVIFELLHGFRPFSRKHVPKKSPVEIPFEQRLSDNIKNLISALLVPEPENRLGNNGGVIEILKHPWFAKLDLKKVRKRLIRPPITPDDKRISCSSSFGTREQLKVTMDEISAKDQQQFRGFNMHTDVIEKNNIVVPHAFVRGGDDAVKEKPKFNNFMNNLPLSGKGKAHVRLYVKHGKAHVHGKQKHTHHTHTHTK